MGLPARSRWISPPGGIRRVLCITASPQGRFVQQRPAIQLQQEDRRLGSECIDFLKRGHPALRELKFAPPANHPDPLTGRRALSLFLEHPQSICERGHAIPSKLHVVVQTAANHVARKPSYLLINRPNAGAV